MPPKKRVSTNPKRVDVKSNVQTVVVKVGETPKKKRRARRKRVPQSSRDDAIPMRQLPPVVYQVPAMVTGYANQPPIMQPERVPVSITAREPVRVTAPILEDIGIVGTEGKGVEIIDVPSKKEQLSELITPVEPTAPVSDIVAPAKVRKQRKKKQAPIGPSASAITETTNVKVYPTDEYVPTKSLGFTQKEINEGLQFPTGKANIFDTLTPPARYFAPPTPAEAPAPAVKQKRKYTKRKPKGSVEPPAPASQLV